MPEGRPLRVLFVCTGNSARSQMAEALARSYGGGKVEAFSAGTEPKGLNRYAVQVMWEVDIDISQHESKAFSEEFARTMDYVITVCGHAEERCPILPPVVRRLHWPLGDPARVVAPPDQVRAAFRRSRDEIEKLVRDFLAGLPMQGTPSDAAAR
jgi:arsenate reductase